MNDILIVVDMQNDFIDGALGTAEALAIVPKVKEKIEGFQGQVFFTRDTHQANYMDTQEGRKLPVPYCIEGSDGWQIRPELEALRRTAAVDKPGFGSVQLAERLREMNESAPIGSVTLIGLCTDICVVSNAVVLHSAFLSSTITVLKDLCGTGDNAMGQKALDLLAGMGYNVI